MGDTLARVRTGWPSGSRPTWSGSRGYLPMPSVSATGEGIAAVAEATGAAPPSTCTPAAAFLLAYAGLPR